MDARKGYKGFRENHSGGEQNEGERRPLERRSTERWGRRGVRYSPYGNRPLPEWKVKKNVRSERDGFAESGESFALGAKAATEEISSRGPSGQRARGESGKRLVSKVVSPMCDERDENVTKLSKLSRVLTYSPSGETVPEDAQMIAALNGMEIVEGEGGDKELGDAIMDEVDHEKDDLVGDELMEMEEGDPMKVQEVKRSKPASSQKIKRRNRIPVGMPSRKAEFLRRGSPKPTKSTSKDSSHTEGANVGAGKDARGSTRKIDGKEGAKNTSRLQP